MPKTTVEEVATACAPPPPDPRPCRYSSKEKTERKQQLVDQVRSRHEQGDSLHAIAAELHLARNTVRRYLRREGPVQPTPRTRRLSQLDPFYDYLTERWNGGCSNAHQLFAELQEKGYRGGETTVRSFVARLRKGLSGMARPPKHTHKGELVPASSPSPKELRWLLAKREEDLTPEERSDLMRLLESFQEVKRVHHLLQAFLQMLRERRPERLNGWMKEARACGVKELNSFVNGIERDYDAVRAGLTFHWSQGPVEV